MQVAHELIQIATVGVVHDDVQSAFACETVVVSGSKCYILKYQEEGVTYAIMLG